MTLTSAARRVALRVLGRVDESWYWFYQWALIKFHVDPGLADAMYRDAL
ncbi:MULTISPECIES: hypothetical protein [Streptomyces]